MRKMARYVFVLALGVLPLNARAAVPAQYSVQGVLRDGSGKLQSTMISLTVKLWSAETGDEKVGTTLYDSYTVVDPKNPANARPIPVVNGLFNAVVSAPDLSANIANKAPYGIGGVWLEPIIDGEPYSRQLVTPGIYALVCGQADNLGGHPPSFYVDTASDQSSIGGNKKFTGQVSFTNTIEGTVTNANQLGGLPASSYLVKGQSSSGGTVTSVATGAGLSGGPITNSGTLSVNFAGNGSAATVARGDHYHAISILWRQNPQTIVVPPDNHAGQCAHCPDGYVQMSGNCFTPDQQNIVLSNHYSYNDTWWCCDWRNLGNSAVVVTASVNCIQQATSAP